MTTDQDEFLARLMETFRTEAGEHLQAIAAGLLEVERTPPADADRRAELLSTVFREAHSLKGAARAVNHGGVESVCQALESVLAEWKRAGVAPSAARLDPLHAAVDGLTRMLDADADAAEGVDAAGLIDRLAAAASAGPDEPATDSPPATKSPKSPKSPRPAKSAKSSATQVSASGEVPAAVAVPAAPTQRSEPPARLAPAAAAHETLRIAAAKLDALLLQAEELLAIKLTAGQRRVDLLALSDLVGELEKRWAQAMPAAGGDAAAAAARPSEFLDWGRGQVREIAERVARLTKSDGQDRRAAGAMVDALLEDCKKLLMLPFGTLLESFPNLVRGLARDQGKDVELVLRGAEVEIDKRVLEELKDPLVHLMRNALDHGVEPPAKRAEAGKPGRATVTVAVSQVDGQKVEVAVSDDGRGIDPNAVRAAGVRHGLLSAEDAERLSDDEAVALVFRPELSTSPAVTAISGRGLGLAIVRERAERLGGRVTVDTRPGGGTSFRVLVPVTLATFRGILVRAGGQTLVLPVAAVERVARVRPQDVRTVENRDVIRLNDRAVALARLDRVLGMTTAPRPDPSGYVPVVVVGVGDRRVAFRVDAVLNEQEVLVKPLGRPLVRVRNVAGATVLGSGEAVPILNPADLLKSAAGAGWGGEDAAAVVPAEPVEGAAAAAAPPAARRPSVLVVEDSITARMLLKNILEAAGFDCATAVDGADGWATLATGDFDLVVSDVEMPRMSGLDLTAKIRADPRLGDLPVVLVTALASREDRERGVDVGANAYIVKGSFDQSDLLAAVRRLV